MIPKINVWIDRVSAVKSTDPETQNRSRILSLVLLGVLLNLGLLTIFNFIDALVTPNSPSILYLITDAITIAFFLLLWQLNKMGKVQLASYLMLVTIIIGATYLVPFAELDRGLIIYSIPVMAASFLLFPASSFLFSLLASIFYFVAFFYNHRSLPINYLSFSALYGLSLVSYAIAKQYNRHLHEREKVEADLRISEGRLRAMAENIHEVFWFRDKETNKIVYISPTFESIWGRTCQELLEDSQIFFTGIHLEDRPHIAEAQKRLQEEDEPFSEEYRLTRPDGSERWVWARAYSVKNEAGKTMGFAGVADDITARRYTDEILRESEMRYRRLFENTIVGLFQSTRDGRIIAINPAYARIFGYDSVADFMHYARGRDVAQVNYGRPEERQKIVQQIENSQTPVSIENEYRHKDGSLFLANLHAWAVYDDQNQMQYLEGFVEDITERRNAENALIASEKRFRELIIALPNAVFVLQNNIYVFVNPAACAMTGYPEEEIIGSVGNFFVHPDDYAKFNEKRGLLLSEGIGRKTVEAKVLRSNGEMIYTETSAVRILYNGSMATLILAYDITERKHIQDELRRSNEKLEEAERLARLGNFELDLVTHRMICSEQVSELIGAVLPQDENTLSQLLDHVHPEDRPVLKNDFQLCVQQNIPADRIYRLRDGNGEYRSIHGIARLVADEKEEHPHLFGTLQDVTERVQVEWALRESRQQMQSRLKQLTVLHDIDLTVTLSTDLHQTIITILNHMIHMDDFDAAALLLPFRNSFTLEAQVGMPDEWLDEGYERWNQYYCALPIYDPHHEVIIADLNQHTSGHTASLNSSPNLRKWFYSCAVLPLQIKDTTRGVLLLFSQQRDLFRAEWKDFLDALAMQTAIAIENAELLSRMQHASQELSDAYEATIEGWSRALELRDKETKGHSERVTEWSQRLATEMGMPNEEMVSFRRGVLLHDIGKMGIPDNILLKPGPLNEDEWIIMRQHPMYAYQMLSPIPFLRPAAELAASHHEKWDGTGYPRGLKGNDIPLGARIFAVVDVWDALTSDRPYRPAWTAEAAQVYMLAQSGTHFDPNIVQTFFTLMHSGKMREKSGKTGSLMERN